MNKIASLLMVTCLLVVKSNVPLLATPMRVLVLYTHAANIASGGTIASNYAPSSVGSLNDICNSSNIPDSQATLVGCFEVSYSEDYDLAETVQRLTNPSDGFLDEVHFLRYQMNAQIVVLLVASGSPEGSIGPYNQNAEIREAFAVVRFDYAVRSGWWAFAHEVGHLLGGQHEGQNHYKGSPNGHGATLEYPKNRTPQQWIKTIMCTPHELWGKVYRWSGHYMDQVYGWMSDPNQSEATKMREVWMAKQPIVSGWNVPRPTPSVIAIPLSYSTIQEGLANARSGDLVLVYPGYFSIAGNVTVPAGVTLRLSSGTTLSFASYYKLRVDGTLLTTGACTFTSSGGQWYGIEFYSGGGSSSLYGSTIQNAQYGVFVYNTSVPISNVTSRYNSTGIYTSVYYTQIHHSLVEENTYGVRCEYYGDPTIVFNNIIRYNGYGVYADASSTPYMGNYPGYNSIFWNDYYDVYSMYGGTIQANGNWWGSYPAQPSIEGYVDYSQELSFDPNGWAKVAATARSRGSTVSGVSSDVWSDTTGIADFTAARDLMLSGDEETALQKFQTIANMYPNSIGGMKSLVFIERILEKRGADVKASLESFSSGKASTKVGKTAGLLLVSAILKLGNDKSALEKAESLLRCDDVMIEKHALFNAANISWYRLGDRVKAETYFRTLAKEYPDDPLSISGLATLGEKYVMPAEPKRTAINDNPDAFDLDPSYPNPFNPSTQIRYALPEPGHVSLIVYDALGREVSTLTNTYQEAGYYTATWNATRESRVPVSSGVYFAQLRVTNDLGVVKYAKTTKLLLMKIVSGDTKCRRE